MKKSAGVRFFGWGRLGLAIGFAGTVAGCSSLPSFHYASTPATGNSPVVADVNQANRHPGPFPRFADIPPLPTDVRTPAQWNSAVAVVKAEHAALDRDTAELAALKPDTEAFAAVAKQQDAVVPSEIPTAKTQAESAAYAKALRNRVKPPPLGARTPH